MYNVQSPGSGLTCKLYLGLWKRSWSHIKLSIQFTGVKLCFGLKAPFGGKNHRSKRQVLLSTLYTFNVKWNRFIYTHIKSFEILFMQTRLAENRHKRAIWNFTFWCWNYGGKSSDPKLFMTSSLVYLNETMCMKYCNDVP